jgi:hypothetical protein
MAQNYRILQRVDQCLTQHSTQFRNTIIFKSFVKQNNDSNQTYRYVHDLLLQQK